MQQDAPTQLSIYLPWLLVPWLGTLCMLSDSPGSAYGHVATLRMQTITGFVLAGGRALLGTGSDDDVDVDGTANGKRLSKHERRTRAMQVCS